MKGKKRKALISFVTILLLAACFPIATSAAETGADFSLTLDRAARTVSVTGTGYAPNERVSLVAAYNAPPAFQNLDYISQLSADESGAFSVTFPSAKGEWLGGESYYVALNGVVKSAAIYATRAVANPATRVSIKAGGSYQLDYQIDGIAYEFVSGNNSVARVSAGGLVTPVRAGSAAITLRATDGSNLSSSVIIIVTP
ncbi:MAG: Ig-like domain-containing protein [Clostridiales Family XIII bacterium]|jgi:hypothetical protein|nr:Ig-like domain-containing protein [Clostridiales Family XIII bacterium]